jgi:multicomponent Na+:H+ antiporter subunit D
MTTLLDTVAWLPLIITIPLTAAVVDFVVGSRLRLALMLIAVTATVFAAFLVAAEVAAGTTVLHAVGGWGAPLGIVLRADGLSALMLLITAVIGACVSVYAHCYYSVAQARHFWPLWWFLWSALNALFLSADVFNLYVTLELLGLAAVGLVALQGDAAVMRASLRYLFAALIGSLAYLLGVALLYGAHGTLDITDLAQRVTPGASMWAALALMAGGMMLKTALFPLHFWLPPAHGGATAPVSALLSGLVIKASFYLMLRLWFEVYRDLGTETAATFIGVLGAVAIIWGGWLALRQSHLKLLIAWSTVAQIGYLFLLFPLADTAMQADGWNGGIYQALAHAFAKAAMFLAAGCFIFAIGSDEIERLNGISGRLPIVLFAFAIAAISLAGLPPSAGFIAKWLLLRAAISAQQWWCAGVIMAGGLLTAAYVLRVLRRAFLPAPVDLPFRAVPQLMQFTPLVLALISLALGLNATTAISLLIVGRPPGIGDTP